MVWCVSLMEAFPSSSPPKKKYINGLMSHTCSPRRGDGGVLFFNRLYPHFIENTRVIGQKSLEAFRDAMKTRANDPYTFLLKQNKLPMSLLQDSEKVNCVGVLSCVCGGAPSPFGVSLINPMACRPPESICWM